MVETGYVLSPTKIKVIGLGGAGCNVTTRMVREQIHGVEFIAMNTDAQHLAITEATARIQLGEQITKGRGTGGDHIVGRQAAENSRDEIRQAVVGADMVFITAGMGGGTGTGAAPLVAQIARENGALTIAIVTTPFNFEGTHRIQVADEGIVGLIDKVDTLIVISNDRLLQFSDRKVGIDRTFKMADEVLFHGVQAIAELITVPGLINVDFAGVRTVLKDAGSAWMSIGLGSGLNRAVDAANKALTSPLMDISIKGAKRALFNIAGSSNLTLFEVRNAAEIIRQAVDPEANIIFGVALDPNLGDMVRLTLVATGFTTKEKLAGIGREEEAKRLLQSLKSQEKTDVPPFLR